jgi:hypothetical protein
MPGLGVLDLGCLLFGDRRVTGQLIEIGDDESQHPKHTRIHRGQTAEFQDIRSHDRGQHELAARAATWSKELLDGHRVV